MIINITIHTSTNFSSELNPYLDDSQIPSTMRGISSFLSLLGLFHYAQASDSKECSLSTIAPSKNLTWCPCEDGYFCARLDVGSFIAHNLSIQADLSS